MINEIPYEEIVEIRRQVMYPDKEIKDVMLPDDNLGIHIAWYIDNKPVSVVSIFLKDNELQFRKLATLHEYQHQGYATKIMEWIIGYANDMKFNRIWCNARSGKTGFYKKFGFKETEQTFGKNGYQYIVMERRK